MLIIGFDGIGIEQLIEKYSRNYLINMSEMFDTNDNR